MTNKDKGDMKKIIFWLRFKLMPSEFKKGTWLFVNGDAMNMGDFWKKSSTKKGIWFIPRIEWREK